VSVSKVVIITGGGRGIGKAAALAAAAAGYDVAISYRQDRAAADEVMERVRAQGRRGLAVAADSADEGAIVRLFAEVDRQLGPVDALVNNAGIVGRTAASTRCPPTM
jgi:NAD(P)-dependent dehydrogenase (short-subunit alcohol dehydrogenase family)